MHGRLWEAVRAGIVFRSEVLYKFVHDRVQEAAYSLIPEQLHAEAHLRIGRLLAAHTPPEKRDEVIFEIVNQLNRGVALTTSQEERDQIAELDLVAGKRQGLYGLRLSAQLSHCWCSTVGGRLLGAPA
jgi:predicted ATPase